MSYNLFRLYINELEYYTKFQTNLIDQLCNIYAHMFLTTNQMNVSI